MKKSFAVSKKKEFFCGNHLKHFKQPHVLRAVNSTRPYYRCRQVLFFYVIQNLKFCCAFGLLVNIVRAGDNCFICRGVFYRAYYSYSAAMHESFYIVFQSGIQDIFCSIKINFPIFTVWQISLPVSSSNMENNICTFNGFRYAFPIFYISGNNFNSHLRK